jgi:hypothetical protein
MKLIVSNTCPRCVPIKGMIRNRTDIEILNISDDEKLIEEYNISSVPVLIIGNDKINDIKLIIKTIKESE